MGRVSVQLPRWALCLILTLLFCMSEGLAKCPSIDLMKPSQSISFLDLSKDELSCTKTKVGSLSRSEDKDFEASLISRISKRLSQWNNKNKGGQCSEDVSTEPLSNSYSSDDIYDFLTNASDLLQDDEYQMVYVNSIRDEFSEKIAQTKENEKQLRIKKEELSHTKRFQIMSKAGETLGKGADWASRGSDDASILGAASYGVGQGLKKVLPKRYAPRKIPLASLLPDNSYLLRAIKFGEGLSFLTLGAINIALMPVTFGTASVALGAAGGGVSLAAAAASYKWYNDPKRRLLIEEDGAPRDITRAIDVTTRGASVATRGAIHASPVAMAASSLQLLAYAPGIGGAAQILFGLRTGYRALTGYEQGQEALIQYEKFYRDTFNTLQKRKQNEIRSVLAQAKAAIKSRNPAAVRELYRDPDFLAKVSCMCDALDWTINMNKEGKTRFEKRIKYLEDRLRFRDYKKNIQNYLRGYHKTGDPNTDHYIRKLTEFNKELRTNYQNAFKENQSLLKQYARIAGDKSSRRLTFQPNLTVLNGSRSNSVSLEGLKKSAELSYDEITKLLQRNYELANEIILAAEKKYPHQDWSVLIEDANIGNQSLSGLGTLSKLEDGTLRLRTHRNLLGDSIQKQKDLLQKVKKITK